MSEIASRAPADLSPSSRRGWPGWLPSLALFQLVYLISYIDRQVLSLVVGPVKESLGLSDVQIGFLQGFAFSIVLAAAALLTARFVDTGNRVKLIGWAVVGWCTMTVACGMAQNFEMLLAARTGLAVAEAVVPMAVLSILCDIAPRTSIPRAAALFMMSPYMGSGLALLFGGPLLAMMAPYEGIQLPLLGTFEPWRGLFILLGAPGILFCVMILLFKREPPRQSTGAVIASQVSILPFLRQHGRFLFMLMTFLAFLNSIAMTIYAWTPTYMIRVHGFDPKTVGLTVGPLLALSGVSGCLLGTFLMSSRRPEEALSHVVRMMMRLTMLSTVPLLAMPLAPSPALALALLSLSLVLNAAVMSSTLTPIQLFAPGALRGRATAVCGLYSAGFGGIGPLAVGAITDYGFGSPDLIHYSIAISFGIALAVAWITGPIAVRWSARMDRASAVGEAQAAA